MEKMSVYVRFFVDLAKTQSVMNRRFDSSLNGLGLNEFIIMYYLSQAEKETLRRIDLAEKIGLTASGVTRLLLPMEKIGLIKSGESKQDARVRCVTLAPGGKQKLLEGLERAELLSQEAIPSGKSGVLEDFSELLSEIVMRTHIR